MMAKIKIMDMGEGMMVDWPVECGGGKHSRNLGRLGVWVG